MIQSSDNELETEKREREKLPYQLFSAESIVVLIITISAECIHFLWFCLFSLSLLCPHVSLSSQNRAKIVRSDEINTLPFSPSISTEYTCSETDQAVTSIRIFDFGTSDSGNKIVHWSNALHLRGYPKWWNSRTVRYLSIRRSSSSSDFWQCWNGNSVQVSPRLFCVLYQLLPASLTLFRLVSEILWTLPVCLLSDSRRCMESIRWDTLDENCSIYRILRRTQMNMLPVSPLTLTCVHIEMVP